MSRHQARARFGQNFLKDQAVIDEIVRAIAPQADDKVIEIGPGLCALTNPLLARLDHLTVVEIDRDLAARLRQSPSGDKLTVIEQDALGVDYTALGEDLRLVGNLPYNISTPLLFAFLVAADHVKDQHFMLQREVIDRMVASVGSSAYGRLSVMLQYRYRMDKLFDVAPEAFDPAPKVVSAIVRMIPLPQNRLRASDDGVFSEVVQRAFSQRRKMLRRALGDWAQWIDWSAVGVEPTDRAEQVSVEGFVRMADVLTKRLRPSQEPA